MAALASYQLTPVRNRYASSRKKARKARSKFAPLRPLYSTALLQPSMIDFNPPSLFLQLLSFLLRHLPVMGRPVFRVPILGNRPKYPDEPKALPMHHPPLRWDFHLPNRPIPLPIRIHPTVALQPGQEKLAEGGMSFRFFKDAYQLSISTYSGLKPRSRAFRSISWSSRPGACHTPESPRE